MSYSKEEADLLTENNALKSKLSNMQVELLVEKDAHSQTMQELLKEEKRAAKMQAVVDAARHFVGHWPTDDHEPGKGVCFHCSWGEQGVYGYHDPKECPLAHTREALAKLDKE